MRIAVVVGSLPIILLHLPRVTPTTQNASAGDRRAAPAAAAKAVTPDLRANSRTRARQRQTCTTAGSRLLTLALARSSGARCSCATTLYAIRSLCSLREEPVHPLFIFFLVNRDRGERVRVAETVGAEAAIASNGGLAGSGPCLARHLWLAGGRADVRPVYPAVGVLIVGSPAPPVPCVVGAAQCGRASGRS